VYLFLAFFWIGVAVVLQLYWETVVRHAYIPVDRNVVSFVCFVLFSYNFIRWRMARIRDRVQQEALEPPPRPRRIEEYDPTFDFSDAKPADAPKKDAPPKAD
jgi:hypothetical protein